MELSTLVEIDKEKPKWDYEEEAIPDKQSCCKYKR